MSCGGTAIHNANRAVLAEVTRASGLPSRDCAVVFHELIARAKADGCVDQQQAEAWARQHLDRVVGERVAVQVAARQVGPLLDGFDEAQRMSLVEHGVGLAGRRLAREGIDPAGAGDVAGWVAWLDRRDQAAGMVVAAGEGAVAVDVGPVDVGPVPQARVVAYLQRAEYQAGAAARAYRREGRLLAGVHGREHTQVQQVIEGLRGQWDGESVPAWFTAGVNGSYWGADAMKRPPTDPATMWAWHQVLTRPELTAGCGRRDGYVVFDTETTGVTRDAVIVQLTAIRYDRDDRETGRVATYVRPDGDLDAVFGTEQAQAASTVTGITAATVRHAPRFAEVAPAVRELMAGQVLVGHNVLFDYPRVQRALAAAAPADAGPGGVDGFVLPPSPLVDTLRLARWAQPNPGVPVREWRHTLAESCARAGIAFDAGAAHDATYDVHATQALFAWLRRTQSWGGPHEQNQ